MISVSFFLFITSKASFSFALKSSLEGDYEWKRLLHYKNSKSEIDSKSFFVHPEGHKNPDKELNLFLEKIIKIKNVKDESLICRFPLRYLYTVLKTGLGDENNLKKCNRLSAFINRVGHHRISVAFSSYFMGNPGSTFGHTLLKVSKKEHATDENKDPLLSYGVNYAASAGEERGFFYALKGLTGFYKGEFTVMPYYYKVREYNDFESRDLWIYDLNLTKQQKLKLVYHLWELGEAKADYYFFNKNCSYFVLKVIDVVLPESQSLSQNYNRFVIPSETIKTIYKKGLVKKVHFRPSVKTKLDYKLKKIGAFSKKQKVYKEVQFLNKGKASPGLKKLSPLQLDAALDMYDFLYSKDFLKDEAVYLKKKRPLLVELSKINLSESNQANVSGIEKRHGPHEMHNPKHFGVKSKFSKDYHQYNLFFRPAFHSYLEPTEGVMKHGEIVLGQISVGVLEDKNRSKFFYNLNSAQWINVSDHSPVLIYKWPFSWEFGLNSVRPLYDQSILEHQLKLATGLSFSLGDTSFLYLMNFLRLAARGTGSLEKLQHEQGVKLGFRLKLSNRLYVKIFGEAFLRNGFKESFIDKVNFGAQSHLQWQLSKSLSINLNYENRFNAHAYESGLIYSF